MLWPVPATSLRISSAWSVPITPAAAPNTPTSLQDWMEFRRRRLGKQAAIAGPPLEGRELAGEFTDGGADQSFLREEAGIGDQEAGGEIVRSVGHDVVAADELLRVVGRQPRGMGFDLHMGVEGARGLGGGVGLGAADVGGPMRDLALQVGQADRVEIDDAERADPRRRQIEDHRAAQPARAHHQHAGRLEARLTGAPHLAQHDVARVTLNS